MEDKEAPLVYVIVLNWNQRQLTLECLESISRLDYPGERLQVVVVDNGSQDGSVEAIRETYPRVVVIENGKNLGYSGGNNAGMRYAFQSGAAYTWIVNNDLIVQCEALSTLVHTVETEGWGMCGPAVMVCEKPDQVLSAGLYHDDAWNYAHYLTGALVTELSDQPFQVDALSGCAILCSRRLVERVGLLDEDFYLYYEDIDWCYRAMQAGFKIMLVPTAQVWHPDTTQRDENSARVLYYLSRNRLLFARKHHLGKLLIFRILLGYLRMVIAWTIRPKWRGKKNQRRALLQAVSDFFNRNYGEQRTAGRV